MGTKNKYRIIDRSGATVAIAETIDDARYAAEKYDAKHIVLRDWGSYGLLAAVIE